MFELIPVVRPPAAAIALLIVTTRLAWAQGRTVLYPSRTWRSSTLR